MRRSLYMRILFVVVQALALGDRVKDERAALEGELAVGVHLVEGKVLVHLHHLIDRLVDEVLEGHHGLPDIHRPDSQLPLQEVNTGSLPVESLLPQQLLQGDLIRVRVRVILLLVVVHVEVSSKDAGVEHQLLDTWWPPPPSRPRSPRLSPSYSLLIMVKVMSCWKVSMSRRMWAAPERDQTRASLAWASTGSLHMALQKSGSADLQILWAVQVGVLHHQHEDVQVVPVSCGTCRGTLGPAPSWGTGR